MLGADGFYRSVLGAFAWAGEAYCIQVVVCPAGCFHKFVTCLYGEGKPVIHWQASLIKLLCNKTV